MSLTTDPRLELLPPNTTHTCYQVPAAFSSAECQGWIRANEARGYAATGAHYPANYRNNDRLVFDDPALAETLGERLREVLPREIEREGQRWRLVRLNERFRCCRYGEGQSFAIHRDGPYAPHESQRSWLTLMLYLNGSEAFEGGETRFFRGREGAEELACVTPSQGSLVVFSHELWHSGEPVHGGHKHILRTDLIYERVSRPSSPQTSLTRAASPPSASLQGHQSYVWSVAALSGGRLVSGGRDGSIRIWSERGHALHALRGAWRSVTALCEGVRKAAGSRDPEPKARALWAGHRDGEVQRFDPAAKGGYGPPRSGEPDSGAVLALAALREGPERGGVLSASSAGTLTWRDAEGALTRRILAHEAWIWALAPRPKGGWISGCAAGLLRFWSAQGELDASIEIGAPIRAITCLGPSSADTGRVALGLEDGRILLRSPGEEGSLLGQHAGIVRALCALPGGRLASAGEDERVRIWSLEPGPLGERLLATHAHRDFVTSLAWVGSPRRGRLASASYDGSVALWDSAPERRGA